MTEVSKAKTYDAFWKSFGLSAYEENSVPTGKKKPSMPYITYEAATGTFNETIMLNASIWTRSPSWERALEIADEVSQKITNGGYIQSSVDDTGVIWIKKGQPFLQRMPDEAEDNMVKRILLNLEVEFISED